MAQRYPCMLASLHACLTTYTFKDKLTASLDQDPETETSANRVIQACCCESSQPAGPSPAKLRFSAKKNSHGHCWSQGHHRVERQRNCNVAVALQRTRRSY
ncbi:unnamed protein product [Prorocentrum cordatum]|uniref:Uncharacterized protein n=1 Tax=Prorocentrum cordatum TaxID=2364126 RepID=A0ABN9T007_9DINO|nr:unnamed protein product [Polarella glacialis]